MKINNIWNHHLALVDFLVLKFNNLRSFGLVLYRGSPPTSTATTSSCEWLFLTVRATVLDTSHLHLPNLPHTQSSPQGTWQLGDDDDDDDDDILNMKQQLSRGGKRSNRPWCLPILSNFEWFQRDFGHISIGTCYHSKIFQGQKLAILQLEQRKHAASHRKKQISSLPKSFSQTTTERDVSQTRRK